MPFEIFISLVLFGYGTIIGSFLNVVILRTAKKEQFVKGRSHCPTCNHVLAWYDLFPVLSWVSLGGKCRYCKVRISPRYAIVEFITGMSFVTAFLAFDISIAFAFAIVLFPILICLSFFDIDTGEIEYWCPISIAALGVVATTLSLLGITDTVWYHHLIGAVIISAPFTILLLFGGMGGADVQLMAAAGLLLGWNIVPAALIGILLGAIGGIIFKATTKTAPQSIYGDSDDPKQMKGTAMPFGPFLAVGIAAAFLCGDVMIDWYLRIMGG